MRGALDGFKLEYEAVKGDRRLRWVHYGFRGKQVKYVLGSHLSRRRFDIADVLARLFR